MIKPAKPIYTDFGLTESLYNDIRVKQKKYDKMQAKYEGQFERVMFLTLLGLLVALGIYLFYNKETLKLDVIWIWSILLLSYLILAVIEKKYLSRWDEYLVRIILAKKNKCILLKPVN